jgi:hypothetical protein
MFTKFLSLRLPLLAAVFLSGAGIACAQQAIDVPGNMLENGAFTKGTQGWAIHSNGGGPGTMAMDDKEKHSNRPSLRVENVEGCDTLVLQTVAVKPNMHYRMTAFIKTKDVATVKRGGKDGASLAIAGGFIKTPSVAGTKVWTRVTHEFNTGNETKIELGPRLGHYSNAVTGTAWFADLSLVEAGKAHGK